MYELPASLLVANSINRYLINSPNWLPAPQGPFQMFARLYWPKQDALDGKWKAPQPQKV